MEYKIWAVIEEIDDDKDHYQDVSEPAMLGNFNSLDEAQTFLDTLDPYPK